MASQPAERPAKTASPDPNDLYLQQLIRCKARKFARQVGLRAADIDDVEQELWLDLLTRMPCFDAGRGADLERSSPALWTTGSPTCFAIARHRNAIGVVAAH